MNKIISYIRLRLAAWREHRGQKQFQLGYRWARVNYFVEDRDLDWITRQVAKLGGGDPYATPLGFGVMKAVWEIQRLELTESRLQEIGRKGWQRLSEATPEDREKLHEYHETNANGDPVGVPFFIDPPVCPDCEGAGVIYEGGMSMNPEIDNDVPCPRCSSNSGE